MVHFRLNENGMDKLQAMRVFITVVETGGFTAAAKRLDVSTSVVSRLMTELEDELGTRLVTRTARVVQLTDTGSTYVEDCRRILADIDEAEHSAIGTKAMPRGQLVVTAPVIFGRIFIVPLLERYAKTYPDVEVSCWFLDRDVNIVEEGADVAVRVGILPSSSLQAIAVGRARRVICASPGYLAVNGVPQHPSDLSKHTIIVRTAQSLSAEWHFADGDRIVSVKIHPRFTTTTNDSAVSMTTAGLGVVSLLSYQITRELGERQLQIVLPEYEPPPVPIHVLHRGGRHTSVKVRAFLDLAIENLRAHPALFPGRLSGDNERARSDASPSPH